MKKIIFLFCAFTVFFLLGYAHYRYKVFYRIITLLKQISGNCNKSTLEKIRKCDTSLLTQPCIVLPPRTQSIALSHSNHKTKPAQAKIQQEFFVTVSFERDGLLNQKETISEQEDYAQEIEEAQSQDKHSQEAEQLALEILSTLNINNADNVWKTLGNETYENQDKFLAHLMALLVDPKDKRSYKTIARATQRCTKLWEKHAQFGKIIMAHGQKPKAQAFLDEFNGLEDIQLPPYCVQARIQLSEQVNKLTYWEQGKIWWKF